MAPTTQVFIMAFIIFIVAVMACDFWGIEQEPTDYFLYSRALSFSAYFFYAECVIKIFALGPEGYFGDNWSRFDFFLVCTTVVDQFAAELLAQILPIPPMLLRVLRVFRVLRILRLLKGAKDLRNLIVTLIYSFPSLVNVCGVLMLITFMYSVLGVDLFTFVVHRENIDDNRNFMDIGHAALLLFQCLTNDAWSGLMADALIEAHTGECSNEAGNCGSWVAIPYFISFQVIGSFVFLNLVVAIILENFTSLGHINPDLVTRDDVERFKEVWALFDPDADNYMPARQLPALCQKLSQPLGFRGRPKGHAVRACVNLKLDVHPTPEGEGMVAFTEVLDALIAYNFKQHGGVDVTDGDFVAKVSNMGVVRPASPPVPSRSPPPSLVEELTAAERLAMGMSGLDVAQTFALQTIAKYIAKLKKRVKEKASAPGAPAPRAPKSRSQEREAKKLEEAKRAMARQIKIGGGGASATERGDASAPAPAGTKGKGVLSSRDGGGDERAKGIMGRALGLMTPKSSSPSQQQPPSGTDKPGAMV